MISLDLVQGTGRKRWRKWRHWDIKEKTLGFRLTSLPPFSLQIFTENKLKIAFTTSLIFPHLSAGYQNRLLTTHFGDWKGRGTCLESGGLEVGGIGSLATLCSRCALSLVSRSFSCGLLASGRSAFHSARSRLSGDLERRLRGERVEEWLGGELGLRGTEEPDRNGAGEVDRKGDGGRIGANLSGMPRTLRLGMFRVGKLGEVGRVGELRRRGGLLTGMRD